MIKSLFYYCLLLPMTIHTGIAQNNSFQNQPIDSILPWLEETSATTNMEFPAAAHATLKKVLAKKDYELAADIHGMISFWNYINYEVNGIDSTMYHRIKQIKYDREVGNTADVGNGYLDLAVDLLNDNQFNNGQDTLFKSIKIFESINETEGIAEAHATLAELYIATDKPEKALYFARLSNDYFEAENIHMMVVNLASNVICEAYMMLEEYDNAILYIDKAIKIATENDFQQKQDLLIEAYGNKGHIYLAQEKYTLTQEYFNKAWKMDEEFNGAEKAEKFMYNIGEAYFLQGNYTEALPYLQKGALALQLTGNFGPDKFERLSTCYEKLGQYEEALLYKTKAAEIAIARAEEKIANLESEGMLKYETNKKDEELRSQTQMITQKNRIQALSIGAAGLLAIFLATLFYFFRKNKATSKLLEKKNSVIEERNKQNEVLLKEIHHRVKNNLQVISSLLNFQSRSIDDQAVKTALLDSQSRVRSMSLIHQKLYKGAHLASVEMKNYLGNLSESLIDAYADEDSIQVELDMDTFELDVDYAIPLGLIANELVTNSLKYAFPNNRKGEITIQLQQDKTDLILQITDNGVGKSTAKKPSAHDGFGSELIEMLSYQLKGELIQNSDKGFQTRIKFPYTKAA